jgi:transposase
MVIRLARKQKRTVRSIAQRQRGEARLYRRARMILLADGGESVSSIARKMGTCRAQVGRWIQRFKEGGPEGLRDAPRSGRPPEVTSLERHQVIATACRSPRGFGLHRAVWSHEALAEAVVSAGLVRSISSSTVGRILLQAQIKPHRVKMWCHSNDPAYQQKMKAIVKLYVDPPQGEPVLCIDEKTGIQALSRARQLQPAGPARPGRFGFEYKRNGTRCLFACFNIGSGKVLGQCTASRKRPDFLSFMDRVASTYRQSRVHVVLDNLNTHCNTRQGDFVTNWNRCHGNRFVFHYTPTHGSWLNQIELWFSIISRCVLRYGNFHSPDELIRAIYRFIREWNRTQAHPFRWSYQGLPLVK